MTDKLNGNGWRGYLQLGLILVSVGASWASLATRIGYIESEQNQMRSELMKMMADQKSDIMLFVTSSREQFNKEIQTVRESGSNLAIKDHDRIVVLEETYKNMTTALKGLETTMTMNFDEVKKQLKAHIEENR